MIQPYYQNEYVTLYKGDCLQILPQLDVKVDCVITDPPYLLQQKGGYRQKNDFDLRMKSRREQIKFISRGYDLSVYEKIKWNNNIVNMLIFCSNRQISQTMRYFEQRGYSVTLLVWQKSNCPPISNLTYMSDLQFIVYVRSHGAYFNNKEDIRLRRKLKIHSICSCNRLHPTQKPLNLIEEYIRLHSKENDIILDCFSGSGTTGIACMNTNRKCILIQKQQKYCQITVKRLQEMQKEKQESLF